MVKIKQKSFLTVQSAINLQLIASMMWINRSGSVKISNDCKMGKVSAAVFDLNTNISSWDKILQI